MLYSLLTYNVLSTLEQMRFHKYDAIMVPFIFESFRVVEFLNKPRDSRVERAVGRWSQCATAPWNPPVADLKDFETDGLSDMEVTMKSHSSKYLQILGELKRLTTNTNKYSIFVGDTERNAIEILRKPVPSCRNLSKENAGIHKPGVLICTTCKQRLDRSLLWAFEKVPSQ